MSELDKVRNQMAAMLIVLMEVRDVIDYEATPPLRDKPLASMVTRAMLWRLREAVTQALKSKQLVER